MFAESMFLRGAVGMSMLPTSGVLIDLGYAWLLILVLLTLCCGLLWALSRPARDAARKASSLMTSRPRHQSQERALRPGGDRKPLRVAAAKITPRSI